LGFTGTEEGSTSSDPKPKSKGGGGVEAESLLKGVKGATTRKKRRGRGRNKNIGRRSAGGGASLFAAAR